MSAASGPFGAMSGSKSPGLPKEWVSPGGDRVPPAERRRERVAPRDPAFRGFRLLPRRYPVPLARPVFWRVAGAAEPRACLRAVRRWNLQGAPTREARPELLVGVERRHLAGLEHFQQARAQRLAELLSREFDMRVARLASRKLQRPDGKAAIA